GLNEPPEIGPTTVAAVKMNAPIATGANSPCQGARLSVATAWITITKNSVAMITSMTAAPFEMPCPGAFTRALATVELNIPRTSAAAAMPPTSWAPQYIGTSTHGNCPPKASPRETAGLKCPPETWPKAKI